MQKKGLLCGAACMLGAALLAGGAAHAGGGQSYPNGAEAFMAGAVPPPGKYFLNYTYYYTADTMNDDNGDEIAAFDEVNVIANVFRFLWMSEATILGANYGQHVFLPVINTDLSFKAPVGPQATMDYDDTDVPYIIYSPMVLAWHFPEKNLHLAASVVDLYVPTGQDDGNMASVGHNFWTFEPVFAVTWMAGNWEVSSKFMYDINTTQDDCATVYGVKVDRDPGDEFHFDYSVSYAIRPEWRLGVSGYYYQQVSDDSFDMNSSIPAPVQALLQADEGYRSQVVAVGPGIWYNHKNMFFELRTQFETAAENKTEGQNVWFKFTYAF